MDGQANTEWKRQAYEEWEEQSHTQWEGPPTPAAAAPVVSMSRNSYSNDRSGVFLVKSTVSTVLATVAVILAFIAVALGVVSLTIATTNRQEIDDINTRDAATSEQQTSDESHTDATSTAVDTSSSEAVEAGTPSETSVASPATTGAVSVDGPAAGTRMAIIGVRDDDVLNVRDAPSGNIIAYLRQGFHSTKYPDVHVHEHPSGDVVSVLNRLDGLVATGLSRKPDRVVWHQVDVGIIQGWVSDLYVGLLGDENTFGSICLPIELEDESNNDFARDVDAALKSLPSSETTREAYSLIIETLKTITPNITPVIAGNDGFIEAAGTTYIDLIHPDKGTVRGYRIGVSMRAAGDWMAPNPETTAGPFTIYHVDATPLYDVTRLSDTLSGFNENGVAC